MQKDVILIGANAAPFAYFDSHGTTDNIPASKILGRGRVPLHEAFALAVDQKAALAAHAFGNQATGAINTGGMELHEFHILQR